MTGPIVTVAAIWTGAAIGFTALWAWAMRDRRQQERRAEVAELRRQARLAELRRRRCALTATERDAFNRIAARLEHPSSQ